MLEFFVENPPVATVENVWQILSNRFISPATSKSVWITVSPM